MLTISVRDLGPLTKGTVELKPLTIFVGPSNTGKSYMAAAIWAVVRAFGWDDRPLPGGIRPAKSSRRALRFGRSTQSGTQFEETEVLKALQDWMEQQNNQYSDSPRFVTADLPEEVRRAIDQSTRQSLEIIRTEVIDHLRQAYGDDSGFARNGKTADFSVIIQRDSPLLNMGIQLDDQKRSMPSFDVSTATISWPEDEAWQLGLGLDNDEMEALLLNLRMSATRRISDGLPPNSFYLPAARSGIAQAHKVLAAALVRQSSRIGIERINIPTLPGMTTEFLGNLLSLDRRLGRRRTHGAFKNAIEFIETDVLYGSIDLDESAGLPSPEIVYLPGYPGSPTGKYNLDHTSSMVSELAPVVLFLKYLINPGDLLIFEEPESHLHPSAQLQLARGIVRLVNTGVNILITTHSGDFVEQINNLLRMSNVSSETAAQLGLLSEDCLNPDQVSAYGFRMDHDLNGSVIYPLPVGTDVGIEEQEFLPVAENLYEQAIALQNNRLE